MARLSRIAPELPVSNLQASLTYYEQKLGFRVAMELPEQDYAIVERDDIAVHLFQADTQDHIRVGIHIFTNDLDELHNELLQRGASVTHLSELGNRCGNRDFNASKTIPETSSSSPSLLSPSRLRPVSN